MEINKIFGVGLPRTGTSSLTKALKMLKFDVYHSKGRFQIYRYVRNPHKRHLPRYSLASPHFLDDPEDPFQGFTDTPANLIYPDLDKFYPNSKFILTIRRDRAAWHRSCEKHYTKKDHANRGDTLRYFRMELFGCLSYQYDEFDATYQKHDKSVMDYFKDRPDDFLVMDICDGEYWNKLCPFLGKGTPNKPFPWKHKYGKST